jgi:hypothetical protein
MAVDFFCKYTIFTLTFPLFYTPLRVTKVAVIYRCYALSHQIKR